MRFTSLFLVASGLIACSGNPVEAQLFGSRSLGRSRIQSPATRGPGTMTPGAVTGSRRFLRDQRGSNTFVGTDRSEMNGFVGSTAGRTQGAVVSSTVGLREPPTVRVNKVMKTPKRSGLYPPRLTLGPGFTVPADSQIDVAERSLILPVRNGRQSGQTAPSLGSIRVTVTGRTATLNGEVGTSHDRQVAELLASFEPGVELIENQIRVTGPAQPLPLSTPNR